MVPVKVSVVAVPAAETDVLAAWLATAAGLKLLGALAAASPELLASQVDAAFGEAVDQQVAELFNS